MLQVAFSLDWVNIPKFAVEFKGIKCSFKAMGGESCVVTDGQSESYYNKTMMHPNAPISILVGLGEDPKICLGIQRDQMLPQDNGESGVVTDGDAKALKVIHNSDKMAVIETKPGCMLRGNLHHVVLTMLRKTMKSNLPG